MFVLVQQFLTTPSIFAFVTIFLTTEANKYLETYIHKPFIL
jgi:hypothetical protein